ncbi:MAG TPA: hypothetical protein PK252_00445 [Bacteroidales bacterium]|nr:hypothetical protein [Bacteroidales bacterium]
MKAPKITRSELRTGDTLLYEKTIAVGRIEQIFTRSKFNHSSLVEVKEDGILCYEAIFPRVVCRPIEQSIVHTVNVVVKRPRLSFDAAKYVELSKSLVGKRYDVGGLLAQIPHQLWGGWIGNKSMKKVYCSKGNAWVWNQLCQLYPDWYKVSPDELFEDLLDFDTYILELPV